LHLKGGKKTLKSLKRDLFKEKWLAKQSDELQRRWVIWLSREKNFKVEIWLSKV
jgi:hypothetical protein